MKYPLLALVLSLSAGAAAQTPCHVEFDGNTFADSWNSSAVTMCIKTKATTVLVVQAVQVFTGEQTGVSTVGIWSHDAAKDEPAVELARGSFYMDSTNSWQGANLSRPVVINSGQTFWVSWIPVERSQTSAQNWGPSLPGAQTYKWSRTNSAPWNGPYVGFQWKFRLYCAGLFPGVEAIGAGCPDSNGAIALFDGQPSPAIGKTFAFLGTRLPFRANMLMVLGLQKNFPSIDLTLAGAPGCFVHTDQLVLLGRTATGGAAGSSSSWMLLRTPVPNDPKLRGLFIGTQLWVADPGLNRVLDATFSNGVGLTIQ